MRIINATWEKRNLGIDCKEIIIDKEDQLNNFECLNELNNLSKKDEYLVLKTNKVDFSFFSKITRLGFVFNEILHEVSLSLDNVKISDQLISLSNKIDYKLIPSNNLHVILNEIDKGIFDTDRIALNPSFGKKKSSKRYINWITDEINKNAEVYELTFRNKGIGFFALKKIEDFNYDIFLAGIYNKFKNSGLGVSFLLKSIEELKSRNIKKITTHVSSNNLPVLKIYIELGFTINENQYVFSRYN